MLLHEGARSLGRGEPSELSTSLLAEVYVGNLPADKELELGSAGFAIAKKYAPPW